MLRKLLFALALVSAPLFSNIAHAAPDSHGWAGGLLGLTVPDADDTSSRGIWGLTAGAKLGSEWGIGAYYLTSHKNEDFGKFDFDLYGVQFGYHFEGEANGVFIAGRIGTSKIEAGGLDESPTNIGVVAGYDYMLGEHFSLGGEASFMNISGDDIESFTLLSFMGAAKLWF
jgi:Outer membrane protein beta-barrel domain